MPLFHRCRCCSCHARADAKAACPLCLWREGDDYDVAEARDNATAYGVMYRPSDRRFAPSRHPILGVHGAYAVDRVELRARAYALFAIADLQGDAVELPDNVRDVVDAVIAVDRLYAMPGKDARN